MIDHDALPLMRPRQPRGLAALGARRRETSSGDINVGPAWPNPGRNPLAVGRRRSLLPAMPRECRYRNSILRAGYWRSGCTHPLHLGCLASQMPQRFALVQSDVVRLITFDLVLRVIFTGMMNVAFVVQFFGVHPHDSAPHSTSFRVPAYMIARSEFLCHVNSPVVGVELLGCPARILERTQAGG